MSSAAPAPARLNFRLQPAAGMPQPSAVRMRSSPRKDYHLQPVEVGPRKPATPPDAHPGNGLANGGTPRLRQLAPSPRGSGPREARQFAPSPRNGESHDSALLDRLPVGRPAPQSRMSSSLPEPAALGSSSPDAQFSRTSPASGNSKRAGDTTARVSSELREQQREIYQLRKQLAGAKTNHDIIKVQLETQTKNQATVVRGHEARVKALELQVAELRADRALLRDTLSQNGIAIPTVDASKQKERTRLEHALETMRTSTESIEASSWDPDAAPDVPGLTVPGPLKASFAIWRNRAWRVFGDESGAAISGMSSQHKRNRVRMTRLLADALQILRLQLPEDVPDSEHRRAMANAVFRQGTVLGSTDSRILQSKISFSVPVRSSPADVGGLVLAGIYTYVLLTRFLAEMLPQSNVGTSEATQFSLVCQHTVPADIMLMELSVADVCPCQGAAGYMAGWCNELLGMDLVAVSTLCAKATPRGKRGNFEGTGIQCQFVLCNKQLAKAMYQREASRNAAVQSSMIALNGDTLCAPTATYLRQQMENEKLRIEAMRDQELIHRMLPRSVAVELQKGRKTYSSEHSSVSVLFCDICKFTPLCKQLEPGQVIDMLNELFRRFDQAAKRCRVFKVETIGDSYMACCGCPDDNPNHASYMARFALALLDEVRKFNATWAGGDPSRKLSCRIGVHSGPVMAGVVGQLAPRYHLFGSTVNTASRMESHGVPGKINCSGETYELLCNEFVFERRGPVMIKGLGEMVTYLLLEHR